MAKCIGCSMLSSNSPFSPVNDSAKLSMKLGLDGASSQRASAQRFKVKDIPASTLPAKKGINL